MRKIEVFSAGCPCCLEAIAAVRAAACHDCSVEVRDMNDPDVAEEAKRLGDDLSKLEYAVRLGRRTNRLIKQNVVVSLAVVVVLVIGVFATGLSMFAAVLGHEGSEVLIILNGLRTAL